MLTSKPILVTGSAGFIGFHLSKRLLEEGYEVVGLDNLNDYYSVRLKQDRNEILKGYTGYKFHQQDLQDIDNLKSLFDKYKFEFVYNLAAQAGVRYSLENPFAYTDTNITGFVNLIERCKDHKIKHLIFASSSSVYGANTKLPFSVSQNVNHPISLYAATKKANEMIAHAYASSFGLPVTGLRFFTAYGPWGRPDMALFIFTKKILAGESIDVFNNGDMMRDFTFVDDIVEVQLRLLNHIPSADSDWDSDDPNPDSSFAPYVLYNVGNHNPVQLMDYVSEIEKNLKKKARINFEPIQVGDVKNTFADTQNLENRIDFVPQVTIEEGVAKFCQWYREYYQE